MKNIGILFMVAAVLRICLSPPAAAQAEMGEAAMKAAAYKVERITSEIKIDGSLDDAGWSQAAEMPLQYEWLPGDNTKPPVNTLCRIGYDSDNLYLSCDAEDPDTSQIRAHYMDRDAVPIMSQDDYIIVMLDTFNDERRAFEFRINPLGVQVDGLFNETRGATEDFSWDVIWNSAGKITEKGYAVEAAIPLKQLRFPNTADRQTWGVSFGRSYPRDYRYRFISHPRSRNNSCLLCQANKVTGFDNLPTGRNVEIDPAVTLSRTDVRQNGSFDSGDSEFEPGVDLRWGITPNLSLNATVNPDFSQVEADVAQLAVNERFALMFPEKRTFFLEGRDYFDTPLNAVFTRTVVDPEWGAKLTGKQGDNAIGVFVSQDNVNSLIFPGNESSASTLLEDQNVLSSTLRYRRDVGEHSTLGVLYTGREGDNDYSNHVGGADGFFRFTGTDDLRVQYLRSETQYPGLVATQFGQEQDAFGGDAMYARYQHLGRKLFSFVEYQDLDENFRTDSGFIPRVDLRQISANLGHQLWGNKDTKWNHIIYGTFFIRAENQAGDKTDQTNSAYVRIQGPLQSSAQFTLQNVDQRFHNAFYDDMHRLFFDWRVQPNGFFRTTIIGLIGDYVDYDNNRPADLVEIKPSMDFKLSRRVTASVNHIYRRLDVDGGELFTANVTDLRLWYHFNTRVFTRAIFQYQNIDRDPSLYLAPVASQDENLLTQLLLSYKLNPRTVLFVGYGDNQLGTDAISLTRTDRTFFAKVGYGLLW